MLWLTVPRCNIEENKRGNIYLLAFLICIFWITFFTYFMIWWAEAVGLMIGVDEEIMGLTLLAAGTSVHKGILQNLDSGSNPPPRLSIAVLQYIPGNLAVHFFTAVSPPLTRDLSSGTRDAVLRSPQGIP